MLDASSYISEVIFCVMVQAEISLQNRRVKEQNLDTMFLIVKIKTLTIMVSDSELH